MAFKEVGGRGGSNLQEGSMAQFFERYRQYRQVGFSPITALRFAWLVGRSGRPAPMRSIARR
jgi:hypothetical protein